jgi:hypothetical protein
MLLDDIGYAVAEASTSLTLATNLFLSKLPSNAPDSAVAVYETGGAGPTWTLASTAPAWENPRVQVLVRSTAYEAGRSLAETLWRALDNATGTLGSSSAPGAHYILIRALQSPAPLGEDANLRWLFSSNYQVQKLRST